ncbi:hypothetical protein ACWEWM_37685, partial [Streptomyces tendae]
MDELVRRLSAEGQKTAVGGPSPSVEDFQRRVAEKGYVFIKFTDTAGGTDLGVRVDAAASDLSGADFARGVGSVHADSISGPAATSTPVSRRSSRCRPSGPVAVST